MTFQLLGGVYRRNTEINSQTVQRARTCNRSDLRERLRPYGVCKCVAGPAGCQRHDPLTPLDQFD